MENKIEQQLSKDFETSIRQAVNIKGDIGLQIEQTRFTFWQAIQSLYQNVFKNRLFFISLLSFFQGLYSIQSLAFYLYQVDNLKLTPSYIQFMSGLIGFPWCIKPLFGYLFDKATGALQGTKVIILMCTLSWSAINFYLYKYMPDFLSFFMIQFVYTLLGLIENITIEYLLVIQSKQDSQKSNKEVNHLPIYFGFRALGNLIGGFYGGRLQEYFGGQFCHFIALVLSFVMLFIVSMCKDNKIIVSAEIQQENTWRQIIRILKVLKEKKVFPLIGLVCLLTLTPSYDALMTLYFMKELKFSKVDLANLNTVGTLFYLLALFLYQVYLKKFSSRSIFIATNVSQTLLNIIFMMVVYQSLWPYLWSTKIFCFITQSLGSFIGELNFIPILTTWCLLCPDNLEATSVTLITGIQNLFGNFSNYLGVWVLQVTKTDQETLTNIDKPLWVQNIYMLILTLFVPFVVFPSTKKTPVALKNDLDSKLND